MNFAYLFMKEDLFSIDIKVVPSSKNFIHCSIFVDQYSFENHEWIIIVTITLWKEVRYFYSIISFTASKHYSTENNYVSHLPPYKLYDALTDARTKFRLTHTRALKYPVRLQICDPNLAANGKSSQNFFENKTEKLKITVIFINDWLISSIWSK